MLKKHLIAIAIMAMSSFNAFSQTPKTDSLKYEQLASKVLNFAQKQLHHRYRSGGIKPSGFDCSGFVYYCFKNFGIKLPHSSAAQGTVGKIVEKTEAMPGDLIFFKGHNSRSSRIGHVGMITKITGRDITFIHSAWKGGVRYDFVSADYYRKRFVSIRRIINF